MKRLLTAANSELLAQLAWSKVLLAFDFDGTLAPIVPDREAAGMRPRTRALFAKVCEAYPCAVISGRARADVAARLSGLSVRYVIGNHGLEPGGELAEFERELAEVRLLLAASLQDLPGLELEDKRYSLAVHYRRARHKREARAAVLRAVASLPVPMRVVLGKLVINLVPARAADKGDALLEVRAKEGADTAFYVGDDVTDEDVFALDQPGRLVTARVGLSSKSVARYYLRDQREMDVLLLKFVNLRTRGSTPCP